MTTTYQVTVIDLKSGHKMSFTSKDKEDTTRFAAYYRRKNQAKKYEVELNEINL